MTKKEYINVSKEFYNSLEYSKIGKQVHHATDRLSHSKRVAKMSFCISKIVKCDAYSVVRGSYMHDFFLDNEFKKDSRKLVLHPQVAFENSKRNFEVNNIEEDIIKTHMFPVTRVLPKYKESYVVSISDKIVSIYEFFRYQLNTSLYVFLIFGTEIIKHL